MALPRGVALPRSLTLPRGVTLPRSLAHWFRLVQFVKQKALFVGYSYTKDETISETIMTLILL